MNTDKWDRRFLDLALNVASWSKDKSRRVGCVIVGEGRQVLGVGYNGFPIGVNDAVVARHSRAGDAKYKWTEHAERNAIYQAARHGIALKGTTIYLPWFPCADCSRAIVQTGIKFVVAVEPDWNDPKYGADFSVAREMLLEGGAFVRFVEGYEPPKQVVEVSTIINPTAKATQYISDHSADIVELLTRRELGEPLDEANGLTNSEGGEA